MTLVLSGGLATAAVAAGDRLGRADGGPAPTRCFAPGPGSDLLDDPLVAFLDRLRARPNDALGGLVRATATLAGIIGRRVETVSIGLDSGARVAAWPTPPTDTDEPAGTAWRAAIVPDAGLVAEALDEDLVGGVLAWSTVAMDRTRLRDRLAELRRSPWGDADGDGAALRLAAARAALVRLVEATPALDDLPPPDLIVATGGAFAVAPAPPSRWPSPIRCAGPPRCQLALDHARLLAPLGIVPEESQRQRLMEDLADDMLAPLGSVISPQGLRAGRSAGRLTIRAGAGLSELDLVPGALQLVDLPPGQVATAEFAFAEPVVLGTRGRRFAVEVGGGLGGLLIDLRDVPLRLPDRPEHRRELLVAWQDALWTGASDDRPAAGRRPAPLPVDRRARAGPGARPVAPAHAPRSARPVPAGGRRPAARAGGRPRDGRRAARGTDGRDEPRRRRVARSAGRPGRSGPRGRPAEAAWRSGGWITGADATRRRARQPGRRPLAHGGRHAGGRAGGAGRWRRPRRAPGDRPDAPRPGAGAARRPVARRARPGPPRDRGGRRRRLATRGDRRRPGRHDPRRSTPGWMPRR